MYWSDLPDWSTCAYTSGLPDCALAASVASRTGTVVRRTLRKVESAARDPSTALTRT